jgi:hypothetical protein
MATDPAARPEYARRLWQLPTFLVGLACLWAVWERGDRLRPTLADRFDRAIQALRPAVDRSPPDVDQIQAALRKLPDADPPPAKAAQVRYLTGSAYVALAESTTAAAEADEWWAKARRELEAAADQDLPAKDQKKLRYRLARTWAHSPGTDPARTVDALTKYLSAGDDPAEGYRLLAELYLKATPPDEPSARDSLQNFLKHASTRADARTLNQARVRLAELYGKLGEPEEARRVAERVGPDAPAEVFAAARLLLAAYHKADRDWAAAARVWEQVRDMNGATDDQRALARAGLAEAYVKLDRPADAEAAVQDAAGSDSPEGRAVLFRRADLRLQDPAAANAGIVQDLEAAFAGTAQVRNLVPPAEAKRVCEAAATRAAEAGEFALAVRAAVVYAKVAENGDHNRLVALAQERWASTLTGDEARDHYRAAAVACEAAAKADPTPAGRGDGLRRAAGLYLKADDRPKALAVLGELTTAVPNYPEDRLEQVWAEMGDVYLAAGDKDQARLAFQNAAGRPGPARDRARVRFAALAVEADPAKGGPAAVAALTDVADRPPTEVGDRAIHEEALYLLGEIHLLRKEWVPAEARLRTALDGYPQSPRAGRGRYQLAQVLRHGAYDAAAKIKADRAELEQIKKERLDLRQPAHKVNEQLRIEDRVEQAQKAYEERMRRAYDEFVRAEKLLVGAPDADPAVVRRTQFWAADCAYWLGEFADCADRCQKLMARYRGRADELEAGRDLHRCCRFAAEAAREAKDADGAAQWSKRAAEAHGKVKEALARVPPNELDGSVEVRTRAYWDRWLKENAPRGRGAE